MRSESHYVGRPEAFEGPGPNTLPRHAKTAPCIDPNGMPDRPGLSASKSVVATRR